MRREHSRFLTMSALRVRNHRAAPEARRNVVRRALIAFPMNTLISGSQAYLFTHVLEVRD